MKESSCNGIRRLRAEAAAAGDEEQVALCDAALEKGLFSLEWIECERVMREAAAQGD